MDMNTEKYTIKFIDVILDLYLHIPYEVRNQMRNFQKSLMFGQLEDMKQYIRDLQQKLQLKNRHKSIHKTIQADDNKENSHLFANTMRINEPQTNWEKAKFGNSTFRLKTAIQSTQTLDKHKKEEGDIHKKSSKTILKITKKNNINHNANHSKAKELQRIISEMILLYDESDTELKDYIGQNYSI